jgi:signal transduction histidine kinase
MKGVHIAIEIVLTVIIVIYILWLFEHRGTPPPPCNTLEHTPPDITPLLHEKIARLYRISEFGRLSGGLFHDLMCPLTALIGLIERLDCADKDGIVDVQKYLSKSVIQSRKIGDTLHRIRQQIRIDDTSTWFCLEDEILHALDLLRYHIRETKTHVLFSPTHRSMIEGNADHFRHAIVNIVSNALDACNGTNGTITITVTPYSSVACISIADTGCGIAPSVQHKIFDSFFTTKGPLNGTGLGLSTAKHTIEKGFGGTITVSSTEEQGTTFFIRIPLVCPPCESTIASERESSV